MKNYVYNIPCWMIQKYKNKRN